MKLGEEEFFRSLQTKDSILNCCLSPEEKPTSNKPEAGIPEAGFLLGGFNERDVNGSHSTQTENIRDV